jgi:hypothetical protein
MQTVCGGRGLVPPLAFDAAFQPYFAMIKIARGAWLSACLFTCSFAAEEGFKPVFDGKTLSGWHISAKTGHSRASKNESGGRWVVQDGAIIGSQDIPGNGGIIITDKQFADYEVIVEMNNDFGPDSGLFLRSTEDGKAWQAMIDYHAGGNLMGLYGEGLGAKPSVRNYQFLNSPEQITVVTNSPVALPVLPESWKFFWRHGQWNELRARIEHHEATPIDAHLAVVRA